MMRLTQLKMTKFAPFADGEISFPETKGTAGGAEVQMFTGENGTGKTRVLAALMASLGNLNELQNRVRQDSGTELDVIGRIGDLEADEHDWDWSYGDGMGVTFPSYVEDTWALAGSGMALLEDTKISANAALKPARADESLALSGPVGGSAILQRLMNLRMGVALERDTSGTAPRRLTDCLLALEQAITAVTGQEFSLMIKPGREIKLMAQWGGAELFFSELPDGLRSLLNWLAGWVVLQVENFEDSATPLDEPVILILDEPENHLHPAWQRRVLPALQQLFKNAQLFVVTHSPFVVSSLNAGWIHKFTRGANGMVNIEAPKKASRGDSYMTAMQEILDLADWFDPETEQEIAEFEALLDAAYTQNGTSEAAMRQKAAKLAERSQEVTNLVAGLVAQFDRTAAGKRPKTGDSAR